MLKAKFVNEAEIVYLDALETEEFFNGASRRTLTFTCAPDAMSVDALNALLTAPNLASLTLTNAENNVSNVYDGYVLKLACGLQQVCTAAETSASPAVYEDRLIFKLGKRTYMEEQLHRLALA